MFRDVIENTATIAEKKVELFKKHKGGYFVSAMLAGLYVGIGIMLILSIGSTLAAANSEFKSVVMGISFSIALSLVLFAGSELFTGLNLIMSIGTFEKRVKLTDTLSVWAFSWVGNLVGAIVGSVLFFMTGTASKHAAFIEAVSISKMTTSAPELLTKAILCNILVCLAVWCFIKVKNEGVKYIMIFLCLFAFVTLGFEHSVANMTVLTIGLLVSSSVPELTILILSIDGYCEIINSAISISVDVGTP